MTIMLDHKAEMGWAYIAGFFDGEGSIVKLRNTRGSYRISIGQNYLPVLEQIGLFLNTYDIHWWITKKRGSKAYPNSSGYHLAFASSIGVRLFIEQILPYLIVKRDLAIKVLSELTNKSNKQPTKEIYAAAKILLRKGNCSYETVCDILGVKFSYVTLRKLKEDDNYDPHA